MRKTENSLLLANGQTELKALFKILALKPIHGFSRTVSPRDKH